MHTLAFVSRILNIYEESSWISNSLLCLKRKQIDKNEIAINKHIFEDVNLSYCLIITLGFYFTKCKDAWPPVLQNKETSATYTDFKMCDE